MSVMETPGSAKHDDLVGKATHSRPAANPFAASADVTIVVPDTVEVRLVDASTLSEYESWSLIASILSSAVVGFLVAYYQAPPDQATHYLSSTVVFALLFVVALLAVASKRHKLAQKTRKVRFRIGDPIEQ